MDRFAQLLGALMLLLTLYVVLASHPPVGAALARTFWPTDFDALSVVTIVGGTVGGYITFAGAHRLLDAGVAGPASIGAATRSAGAGIAVASAMRVLLFLAALGVVSRGVSLDPTNPAAAVFRHAAGNAGGRMFGAVMWAAAITSIVGSAYTSVSFLRTLRPGWERFTSPLIITFIVSSTAIFLAVGRPVSILIAVGAVNAMILPLGLGTMLLASRNIGLMNGYRHPAVLTLAGTVVALLMTGLGVYTLSTQIPPLFR